MSCSSRAGRLRAIAPFATITLLLLSSSLVSAGPREDREAATAASEKASSSPAPAPDAAPSPSASAALGSGAPKNASFLFTITAKKATLEIDPKRNDSAILKLLDANPHVLWFTDKPSRAAGALDAEVFLSKAFSSSNGTGPWLGEPNAVVLGMGPGGPSSKANKYEADDEAAVVTLRSPSIDSKGVITFQAEIIKAEGPDAEAEEGSSEGEEKREQRKKTRKGNPKVSSDVARNYLKAGEKRAGEGEGAPVKTHLLESPPKTKLTWENVQLFIDDYYMEQPAAAAAPAPPPPTVVVVQAPPPPPPPPPPPAAQSYQSSIWNRIDGPQPIDAYRCGFMGGCGYGGFGLGGWGRRRR